MLKAIIIDDNKSSIQLLSKLLDEYFDEVKVIATCTSVDEGSAQIEKQLPDIVFLDVEMPGNDGFQLFKHYPEPEFETIFITAFSKYAADAFRVGSIDYLVKPIDPEQLKEAINRVKQKLTPVSLKGQSHDSRLAISTQNGTEFIPVSSIIYCEADDNYTTIYHADGSSLVSKPLKSFQLSLEALGFFRSSRSHLVNTKYIKLITNGKKPEIHLKDDLKVPLVSARKKDLMALMLEQDNAL